MSDQIGYREVLALTLEQLGKFPESHHELLAQQVVAAAKARKMIPLSFPADGWRVNGRHQVENRIYELVREAMWECLIKRLIVFGTNSTNPNWPFYKVTEYGENAVKSTSPQPYDPDGFLKHFDAACEGTDSAVRAYVEEAVLAFNSGCMRSSAVMLGCASEKLLLLLAETFEEAITDEEKKKKFSKDIGTRWQISHKYEKLRDRLDRMVAAKKLSHEHSETVGSELPAGFELLRRCRNAAGHPDVPGNVAPDTVFLNLRMFTEYAHRVQSLIEHFQTNAADW